MKNINTISMHWEKFYQLHTETTTAKCDNYQAQTNIRNLRNIDRILAVQTRIIFKNYVLVIVIFQ